MAEKILNSEHFQHKIQINVLDADDDNLVDEIGEADEEDEDDGNETRDQNDNS